MSALNTPLDEQIFIALQAYEQLKYKALRIDSSSQNEAVHLGRLSFNDIVNYVKDPNALISKDVLSTINSSLDYRRKYRFVLMQLSLLQSPRQIAASSSWQLLERREDQFSINITEHSNEQILVQLNLLQSDIGIAENKPAFLHCESEQGMDVLTLTSAASDQFVLAVSKDDKRLFALMNVNTHIFVTF